MRPHITAKLHDHLDGSAAVRDVIVQLHRLAKKPFPFADEAAWLAYMRDSDTDIVERFDTITSVLQSDIALEMLAASYGARRAAEGIRYAEPKFAPQYHTRGGLSLRGVVDAVVRGFTIAERAYGIRLVPAIAIGREADEDLGIEVARVALAYDGRCILDLACNEADHPPEKHLAAFRLTFGSNVRRDCHAGEWVNPNPAETYRMRLTKNLRTAIVKLRVHSVGHAITLADEPELMRIAVDRGVRVVGCPLSNLKSGLIADVRDLGIDRILDFGVCYTFDADDDLFLPTLAEVEVACDAAYHFTSAQAAALERNAWLGAFGSPKVPWSTETSSAERT